MPNGLPEPIRNFLADFVARRRRLALAKAAALALAAFLGILLIACTADRLFKLSRGARAILLVGDLAVVAVILRRPIAEAIRPHANWIEAADQVEAIDPTFAQRLTTVTSQLQSPATHRGSPGMLAALIEEVATSAAVRRGGDLLSLAWIKRSLTLAGCFTAVTFAAMAIPWLQFPQLVARFTRPWANLAAVTTTRLVVLPGSTTVPQGRPLRVTVTAQRAGDSPAQLHVQQADGWSVSPLEATDPEHFAGELPPLPHDSNYFVTAGDAQSEMFAVHVLTSPGLNELRARVQYPAYLKWDDKSLTVTDNRLELPVGSEVTLSLVASEPLQDATLALSSGPPLPTTATIEPSVRTAKLTIKKDSTISFTLRSRQGVEQAIAQPLVIKSIPDRAPLVRLLAPAEDLRLGPTDVLTTAGQAMDDYGIAQLFLQVKVNDRPAVYQSIAITGDKRRVEQPIDCDLAALGVAVGDLLQIQLLAKDTAGQQRGSDTLRIIVSPRSFDLNAYLRTADLSSAKKLADDLLLQLQTARNELGQSNDSITKDGDKSLQNLAASAQTAQLLTMPLLRAAARADRVELGDSIAAWADEAEHVRNAAEELQDQRTRRLDAGQIGGRLDRALEHARRTADQLGKTVRQTRAIAIRNDLAAVNDLTKRAEKAKPGDRERLATAAKRLQASIQSAAQVAKLNLAEQNGAMPDVENAINEAQSALTSNPPIDFGAVSDQWSRELKSTGEGKMLATRSALELIALEPRLAMAGNVEMVRPDADFGRARDLSLAARASRSLTTAGVSAATAASVRAGISEFPAAMRDLQAEHQMRRAKTPPANAEEIATKARTARDKMRRWAGDDDTKLASADREDAAALDAAAALQQGKFDEARALDKAKADRATAASQKLLAAKLAKETDEVQRLDMLRQRQQQLAQQTADAVKRAQNAEQSAAAKKEMESLAKQQAALAKAIEATRQDEADARGDTQADAEKQENPAAAIAEARKSLADLKEANHAVQRAADDTARAERAKQVDPSAVEAANQKLAKVSPAADEAHAQIDDKVLGGVRQMQQEARGNDGPTVAKRADDVDAAVKDAMKKLDAAEEHLADRDAMAAAEAASKEAGEELQEASGAEPSEAEKAASAQAQSPGQQAGKSDKTAQSQKTGKPGAPSEQPSSEASRAESAEAAQHAQARTVSALDRAVDRAAMRGGQARVRELPLIDSILSLLPVLVDSNSGALGSGGGERVRVDLPGIREWGRLRPRDESAQTAVTPAADPPGYEQSLKLYFEALGKDKQ